MLVSDEDFDIFLSDISDCFIRKDFATWQSRILLPFSIVTRHGPTVLDTDAALEANFNQYVVACQIMDLDTIVRHAIGLEDCKDGTWLGTYRTRLISKNQLATPAYTSTALLQIDRKRLKMSSLLNGRGHYDWTGEQ